MSSRSWFRAALGCMVCAAALLLSFALVDSASAARAPLPAPRALRVLLVGNSYTKFNVMPRLLQRLSTAVPGARALQVDVQVHGGYSLRSHWRAGLAVARIREGHYDFVVLQGHSLSAVDHPDELDEYAQRFKQLGDETGARTVLYETWPRKDGSRVYRTHARVHSFAEMAEAVDGVYSGLASRLGIGLAPVGRAFVHVVGSEPQLELYRADASHPTPAGSFLVACVLYGALTGEDPRSSRYVPFGLDKGVAEQLKQVAAQTLAAPAAEPAPVVAPSPVVAPALAIVGNPVPAAAPAEPPAPEPPSVPSEEPPAPEASAETTTELVPEPEVPEAIESVQPPEVAADPEPVAAAPPAP
jgi:hypothetical protein